LQGDEQLNAATVEAGTMVDANSHRTSTLQLALQIS